MLFDDILSQSSPYRACLAYNQAMKRKAEDEAAKTDDAEDLKVQRDTDHRMMNEVFVERAKRDFHESKMKSEGRRVMKEIKMRTDRETSRSKGDKGNEQSDTTKKVVI